VFSEINKKQIKMKEVNSADFDKEVLKGGKVVVDFYSTECPPCEALAPKFESVSELFSDEVKFVKVFRQENRDLSDKLAVKSSPTVLYFENGKEVGVRMSGGIKRQELFEGMKFLVGKEKVESVKAAIKPQVTNCDVAILGGGPGGLTAGLYLCQARVNAVLIDVGLPGGAVSTTHQISNYPGFIDPQPGFMLSHYMSEQTKQCGTTYKVAVDVTKVNLKKKEIIVDEFETIKAKKIIIATGTRYNLLNVPGEKELKGNGISYCATCDAKYFVDKHAVVVGGGNSAIEEADFIAKFASKVTIIHQFDKLQANKLAQEKAFANEKIEFKFEHEPRGFKKVGDKIIVEVEDLKTKQLKEIESDGAFIFIGMRSNLEMFTDKLDLDDFGYIKTDEDKRTSIEGVYAVGDVSSKKYRQITTAIADGTIAAISITRELDV
jgi:thioredoxin reductase (NADPH)